MKREERKKDVKVRKWEINNQENKPREMLKVKRCYQYC